MVERGRELQISGILTWFRALSPSKKGPGHPVYLQASSLYFGSHYERTPIGHGGHFALASITKSHFHKNLAQIFYKAKPAICRGQGDQRCAIVPFVFTLFYKLVAASVIYISDL